ncbi:MAG: hypothetical protein SGPRY_001004 [Prymnesium sp.]
MAATAARLLLWAALSPAELGLALPSSPLADSLNLQLPSSLTLPLSLNLLFVGFHGEGSAGLNLTEAKLTPWFQELRARLPHVVLPSSGHRTAPIASAVQYTTRVRVLQLGPEVTSRLEAFLNQNLRPESVDSDESPLSAYASLQVDAHGMSALLNSLQDSLDLPGYTLFILTRGDKPHQDTGALPPCCTPG